jgi:sugar porter (SP) family MFS transporter
LALIWPWRDLEKGGHEMESSAHEQVVTETLNPFVVAAAAVAALGGFLFGFDTGIISGALLFIKQEFGLSAGLQQLVVGSLLVAAVVGALLGGPISDAWGRKRTLILAALVFGVGALVASYSPNLAVLVVARVLLGLAIGIASMIVPVYIAEIAPPRVRGALVSLQQFMITVGIMVSYLVSYAFSGSGAWRWMLGVGMIPAAILFVGMLPLPESPRWLLAKDRRQDALGVLHRIRHEEHNPEAELAEIEAVHKMQAGVSYRDLFRPSVRPALIVGVGIAFINQMVGVNAVIYYAPTILKDAGFSSSAAILATTGVGILNMLVTLCALLLIDRVGRRPLLLVGISGVLLALIVLGAAYLLPGGPSGAGVLLVAGLLVYIASFAASLGIAIWLLNSEVYPLEVRGKGAAAGAFTHWALDFVIASTVLTLIAAITPTGMFWFYGFFAILGIIFVLRRVPETKGKTLEEVSDELASRAA